MCYAARMPLASLIQITTTCSDLAAARQLATEILQRRLAACVQIDDRVESHYRWKGELATEPECRCTFKTSTAMADACAEAILRTHRYETPELIVATVHASTAYANWVEANVGPGGAGEA